MVVPAHGRATQVRRLLAALSAARARYPGPSEVLVIDSSRGPDAAAIRAACAELGGAVHPGPPAAGGKRNAGIRLARHPVVLFVDSDCVPDPDLLREHGTLHAQGCLGVAGVLGLTELSGPDSFAARVLEAAGSFTAAFGFARWRAEVPWGTCTNLSVRRDVLREVGGFDESMPGRLYGEDVDLGLRITGRGHRLVTRPGARVGHPRAPGAGYAATLLRALRTGRADVALGRRHPARLVPEFPGLLTLGLLIALLGGFRALATHCTAALLVAPLWLVLAVLADAAGRAALAGRRGVGALALFLAVVGLECGFEAGKLAAALARGDLRRAATKFVYLPEQLVAERPRRAVQQWAVLLAGVAAAAIQPLLERACR